MKMRAEQLAELPRGTSALHEVVTTDQLASRPSRPPNYALENRALALLVAAMVLSPQTVLQHLVDAALTLCGAGSAGISLLEEETPADEIPVFRWRATSGAFAPLVGSALPRAFSPCGWVLDANRMLLMSDPARHFKYIEKLPVQVCEALLMPFWRDDRPIGTVWVVSHTERQFDREDARLLESLSRCAAAALQALSAGDLEARHLLVWLQPRMNSLKCNPATRRWLTPIARRATFW